MPTCTKCKTSIKPAALACTVSGKDFHPTCVNCSRCDRSLWGKSFVRVNGKLQCERACTPTARPVSKISMPDSSKSVHSIINTARSSNNMANDLQREAFNEAEEHVFMNKKGINRKGLTGKSRYSNVFILVSYFCHFIFIFEGKI